jgi:hypothetical protein
MTPNGASLISTADGRNLKVWDLQGGNIAARFTADGETHARAAASDGMTIVAGDASGRVRFLKLIVP